MNLIGCRKRDVRNLALNITNHRRQIPANVIKGLRLGGRYYHGFIFWRKIPLKTGIFLMKSGFSSTLQVSIKRILSAVSRNVRFECPLVAGGRRVARLRLQQLRKNVMKNSEIQVKSAEIAEKLRELADLIEGGSPAAETEGTNEEEEPAGTDDERSEETERSDDEGEEAPEVVLPESTEAVQQLTKEEIKKLAAQLKLKTETPRKMIAAIVGLVQGEEVEAATLKSLCAAIGIATKGLDAEDMTAKIKEYLGATEEEEPAEEADAKEEESGSEEPADEEPTEEEEDSDSEQGEDGEAAEEEGTDDEEPDYAAIAKKAKLPKPEIMKSRLNAFNNAAAEEAQIEVKKGKEETAYRKLLELLVSSDGEVVEWGTPYLRAGEYMCCGLPLDEIKVKKEKRRCGKCAVTGKVFACADGEFEAVA